MRSALVAVHTVAVPPPPPGNFDVMVPDWRNGAPGHGTDPNWVIDPTGVKDSTAGLKNFFALQPNGTNGTEDDQWKIGVPADAVYRFNDDVTFGSQYQTLQGNAANFDIGNYPRFTVTDPFPWGGRAATSGTGFDPGADIAQPWVHINSTSPPYRAGWDGSCTGNTLIREFGTFKDASVGKICLVWWLNSIDSNGDPIDFPKWFHDVDNGDGTRMMQLFVVTGLSADKKQAFLAPTGQNTRNVRASDPPTQQPGDPQDRFWVISPGARFERYFRPNPAYGLQAYTGRNSARNVWAGEQVQGPNVSINGGTKGLDNVSQASLQLFHLVGTGNRLLNVDVGGNNAGWSPNITTKGNSFPLGNENQVLVDVNGTDNEIGYSNIHHSWGSNIALDGLRLWVHDTATHHAGRQTAQSGKSYQCGLERCTIYGSRHSWLDVEPNGNGAASGAPAGAAAVDEFYVLDCVVGMETNQRGSDEIGGTSSFRVRHVLADGVWSRNSDVGTWQTNPWKIPEVAGLWVHAGPPQWFQFAPQNGCWIIRNWESDRAASGFNLRFMDLVYVHANERRSARVGQGALLWGGPVTRQRSDANTVNGTLDPEQYDVGTGADNPSAQVGFVLPGAGGSGDAWWDAGAPVPAWRFR